MWLPEKEKMPFSSVGGDAYEATPSMMASAPVPPMTLPLFPPPE